MKRASSVIAAIAALLGAAACAQTPAAGDHPPIVGAWDVAAIDGAAVPAGVTATVVFAEDGQVSGVGGCNRYGGRYSYAGGVVTVSELFATKMACMEPNKMDVETKFHQRFTGDLKVALSSEGALTLGADAGSLVLRPAGQ